MGLLDDVLGSAVPGGNLAKPIMIAATALLAARAIGGVDLEIYSGEGLPLRRPRRVHLHLPRVNRKGASLAASAACCRAFNLNPAVG